MTQYWCEWAWLGERSPAASVLIDIKEDRIASVAQDTAPTPDATRLAGLTLPGFANTHSHAFHRALRGRTQSGEGSFWTWREEMYRVAVTLNPDSYHDLAKRTYAEMLAAGYTVVGEFHYLHHSPDGRPYANPNAMTEAVLAAAADTGIRITLLDTLYLYGGIGPDGRYLEPNPVQRRFSDGTAQAWVERLDATSFPTGRWGRLGAAIHSVRAVKPAGMEVARDWCDTNQAPLHIHLSEQPVENDQCLAAHGRTPTQLLADLHILGERLTAVHATHLTDADISLLGAASSTACFCPTTERDLADGIGPSRQLAAAGARLAIGSDSHAVIDPFEETRAIELNARLASLQRGNHAVPDLLKMATAHGYSALGWPDGGRIEAGALADLVTVGLDPEVAPEHLLATAVFAPTQVTQTMVGGVVSR